MSLPTCPKCGSQLEVKLTFASGPRSAQPEETTATGDLGELLDAAEAQDPTGKAAEFVAKTRERYAEYGARTRMSDKQMNWLRDIASGKAQDEW